MICDFIYKNRTLVVMSFSYSCLPLQPLTKPDKEQTMIFRQHHEIKLKYERNFQSG